MDFFDELSQKITQTGQDVMQKTRETTEIYRLNGLISDEARKINAFYQQLGKAYYDSHKGSPDPAYEGIVQQIKDCEARKAQYTDQADAVRGSKKCPHCTNDIPYAAKFCKFCGKQVDASK